MTKPRSAVAKHETYLSRKRENKQILLWLPWHIYERVLQAKKPNQSVTEYIIAAIKKDKR